MNSNTNSTNYEKKILFALDYDGTYTADPELWDIFIASAVKRGHSFIVATMRYPQEGLCIIPPGIERVVYTGRKAKYEEVQRQGFNPNIWIDDMPHFLFNGG